MNMAEKITMRLEQFDSVEDGDITLSGPIQLLTTVSVFENLTSIEDPEDGAVVYVENVTNEPSSLKYRGAYFSYRELTGEWQEILIGTHSHDNKEFLDRLGGVDFGEWVELTDNSNVFIQSTKPTTGLTDKALFFDIESETLEVYNALTQTWSSLTSRLDVNENYFPSTPEIGDYVFYKDTRLETPESRLYIFYPIQANKKKIFTLEVIDTDNSEATYEYNLNWQDLPEFDIPSIPEGSDPVYLGHDEDGKLEWKNNFIAAQTFQLKNILVTEANEGKSLSFSDVHYNSDLDEILIFDGKFFISNNTIEKEYNSNTKVLTISYDVNGSEDFSAGETISILVIRNGAASVLDTLAKDYVTKSEAITLLTGGSVNLKDYITKEEGLGYAKKYHTHSQFSRVGHDHDNRYALFHHTHSEYLTRRAAIQLLEEQLQLHPDILQSLSALSDAIESNEALQDFIANVTAIENIQDEIDAINTKFEDYYTKTEIDSMFRNNKLRSDQIDVIVEPSDSSSYEWFRTQNGEPRDLTDVLVDLKTALDQDYGSIETNEVLLDEAIQVKLGENGFIGDYDTGETIEEGQTLSQIIKKLVQRDIIPVYIDPSITFGIEYEVLSEIGQEVEVTLTPNFRIGNSGGLSNITVKTYLESDSLNKEIVFTSPSETAPSEIVFNLTLSNENQFILIESSYKEGPTLYSNLGTLAEGKITAGDFDDIILPALIGKRALFHGAKTTAPTLSSSVVRSEQKTILSDYTNFDVEVTIPANSRYVYFALPASEGELSSILYKDQGNIDIIDSFIVSQISVDAAEGYPAPATYNVYSYAFPIASHAKMTFTFKK
jgi:hypothetical protein